MTLRHIGGVQEQLDSILTSELDRSEWSVS